MDKKCGFCGVDLIGRRPKTVYCSSDCRVKAHRLHSRGCAAPPAPTPVIASIQPMSVEGIACLDKAIDQLTELREQPPEHGLGLSPFQLALRKKKLGY